MRNIFLTTALLLTASVSMAAPHQHQPSPAQQELRQKIEVAKHQREETKTAFAAVRDQQQIVKQERLDRRDAREEGRHDKMDEKQELRRDKREAREQKREDRRNNRP